MDDVLKVVLFVYGEPREASVLYAELSELVKPLGVASTLEFVDIREDVARAEREDVFATPTIDVVRGARSRRIVGLPTDLDGVRKQLTEAAEYLRESGHSGTQLKGEAEDLLTITVYTYGDSGAASPLYAELTRLSEELGLETRVELVDVRADVARAERDGVIATPAVRLARGGESRMIAGLPPDPREVCRRVRTAVEQLLRGH